MIVQDKTESVLRVIENRGRARRQDLGDSGMSLARKAKSQDGGSKYIHQKTLKNAIHCSGIGVHSGDKVSLTLHPAEPDFGIRFQRTDPEGQGKELKASWQNAVETPLCTTITDGNGVKVATIEHLMSAFAGCGIDNALVEIDGAEVPIMDGSAAPFVFLIECAGTVEQEAPRRALRVLKEVTIEESHRAATLSVGSGLNVYFEIDFDSPAVSRQEWSVQVDCESYKREVARARTFGFLAEVDKLREMGFARGGSLDNAIVINGSKILNEGGLRFDNEFVRHKVLDSIGDLYLIGGPLLGQFRGLRAGHSLTLKLLKALMADPEAFEWVDMTHESLVNGRAMGTVAATA